jgi:hypothetical protein
MAIAEDEIMTPTSNALMVVLVFEDIIISRSFDLPTLELLPA